jgi:hypothetical protein
MKNDRRELLKPRSNEPNLPFSLPKQRGPALRTRNKTPNLIIIFDLEVRLLFYSIQPHQNQRQSREL